MEFSQKDLFQFFTEVDGKNASFTSLSTDDYLNAFVERLPADFRETRLDNCLHAYKKKCKRGKLAELAAKGSDNIVIVLYPNPSSIDCDS